MDYLYHSVPHNLTGEFLMPLNELKKSHPEIYAEHVKKYEGREKLLNVKIPQLNCLWNDVLHTTSVLPNELDAAFSEVGAELEHRKWFKINPRILEPSKSIVYLYPNEKPSRFLTEDFVALKDKDLKRYSIIGPETREYFRQENLMGRSPLMLHLVPHILYKGKLKISDLDIVKI